MKTVIVGLSGGVDSAVSALLLQQQGFDVQGLFMKNWQEDDTHEYCAAKADLEDVKAVCNKLKIPLHTIHFVEEYWENVFSHFLDEYRRGRTPNPDILCNKEIKFKAFLEHAQKLGADFIATGHYVQKQSDTMHYLLKGADQNKDQSYFLYTLGQSALSKSIFPIGHLEKTTVRFLAKEAGLLNHNKKDSTGICFIGERKFKTFLQDFVLTRPGVIQTTEGKNIGEHDGLMFYTLGQRHGLKIGGRKDALEAPWYVVAKELASNILYVTQDITHPWHFSQTVIINDSSWISGISPPSGFKGSAKIRYRQVDQPCTVQMLDNQMKVTFVHPQRAVTPGQSLVIYENKNCLGGGTIQTTDSPGGLRI